MGDILYTILCLLCYLFVYCSQDFTLGNLRANRAISQIEQLRVIRDCFHEGSKGDEQAITVYRHFLAARGKTLVQAARGTMEEEYLTFLSHEMNACSSSEYILSDDPKKAEKVLYEDMRKEFVLHASLSTWPANNMAAKNLAYEYEWTSNVNSSLAISVLTQSMELVADIDAGMALQHVFISPQLLWDESETFSLHISILNRARLILQNSATVQESVDVDPSMHIRELQMNPQYLGISPGVLSIANGDVTKRLFPGLESSKLFLPPTQQEVGQRGSQYRYQEQYEAVRFQDTAVTVSPLQSPSPAGVVRLGIVSEHEDNSSPGNCLKRIFVKLAEYTHPDPVTGQSVRDFEFIFFARAGSRTVFSATVSSLSTRVHVLEQSQGSLDVNRNTVAAERLDILLYIALPTEKLTSFMSHSRLAPVQVVFGVGHPVTSGSTNIDYSVVGEAMFKDLHTLTREPPSMELCMHLAEECYAELPRRGGAACSLAVRSGCAEGPGAPVFYSEQLVLMESLGYFLESHLEIYEEPVRPLELSYESTCGHVNARLGAWGLHPNVTAEQLGCLVGGMEGERTSRSINLYACIQIPKKMHPSFDPVLAGVLRADPRAKILVGDKFAAFFPRLLERANHDLDAVNSPLPRFTMAELHRRILLVPRIHHFDYQQLLSLSSVFLNTFPFGAGITSSEAIAACVPVLVDAARSSILHLGLAQVRRLGPDFEADLVVTGEVEDYVNRAVLMANLDDLRGTSLENKTRDDLPALQVRLIEGEVQTVGFLGAYRHALCRRRINLLGEGAADDATQEWASFLKAI